MSLRPYPLQLYSIVVNHPLFHLNVTPIKNVSVYVFYRASVLPRTLRVTWLIQTRIVSCVLTWVNQPVDNWSKFRSQFCWQKRNFLSVLALSYRLHWYIWWSTGQKLTDVHWCSLTNEWSEWKEFYPRKYAHHPNVQWQGHRFLVFF